MQNEQQIHAFSREIVHFEMHCSMRLGSRQQHTTQHLGRGTLDISFSFVTFFFCPSVPSSISPSFVVGGLAGCCAFFRKKSLPPASSSVVSGVAAGLLGKNHVRINRVSRLFSPRFHICVGKIGKIVKNTFHGFENVILNNKEQNILKNSLTSKIQIIAQKKTIEKEIFHMYIISKAKTAQ